MKHTHALSLVAAATLSLAALLAAGCNPSPPESPKVATTVGNEVDDADIKSLDIGVVTSHGEVQLAGFVGKQSQIEEAERIARAVPGASSIRNELMIKK